MRISRQNFSEDGATKNLLRLFSAVLLIFVISIALAEIDYSQMSLDELKEIDKSALNKSDRKKLERTLKKAKKKERKAKEKQKNEQKKQAELESLVNVPVCFTENNCERKWAEARDWVNSNAGYKIQIYSDDLIETYTSSGSSTDLNARVTKTLLGDVGGVRAYALELTVGCANIFGCFPNDKKALIDFNKRVSAVNTADPGCYESLLERMEETPPIGVFAIEFSGKVRVKQICSGSPAAEAGMLEDDVITSVNGVAITTSEILFSELNQIRGGEVVTIGLIGRYGRQELEVHFPKLEDLKYDNDDSRSGGTARSLKERLEELSKLFDSGLITEDEFQTKRKSIMDSL
jgi:hypothetical protein